jgi:hypothetical protein
MPRTTYPKRKLLEIPSGPDLDISGHVPATFPRPRPRQQRDAAGALPVSLATSRRAEVLGSCYGRAGGFGRSRISRPIPSGRPCRRDSQDLGSARDLERFLIIARCRNIPREVMLLYHSTLCRAPGRVMR